MDLEEIDALKEELAERYGELEALEAEIVDLEGQLEELQNEAIEEIEAEIEA